MRALHRGGLAQRVLSGTTHISVVDAHGSAASLSASLGSGSGVVVPGTGIHLNNMLGEADLVTGARPGERLTSMMAPSIVLRDGELSEIPTADVVLDDLIELRTGDQVPARRDSEDASPPRTSVDCQRAPRAATGPGVMASTSACRCRRNATSSTRAMGG